MLNAECCILNVSNNSSKDIRQRAYAFGLSVLALTKDLPRDIRGQIIGNQLLRASLSIGANLEESLGSDSRPEFKRFFVIALKSANETRYWLRILNDGKLLPDIDLEPLHQEIDQTIRMITAAVIKLKQNPSDH